MAKKQSLLDKAKKSFKKSNEDGARKAVLEDLFYDFNRSKAEIYKMNFLRGMFFAFGSLVGGTVLVVVVVSILTFLVDLPGGIGNFVQSIVDAMNSPGKS